MPRQPLLTPEQIAKAQEMLKAGAKVSDIVQATGAKDYQIVQIKKRLGLVKPRAKTAKEAPATAPAVRARVFKTSAGKSNKPAGELTVNDIRAKLEAAQKEVARWQEALVERVAEIEKMIAAIKKS